MSRSPTYRTLREWIVGRIKRHPSSQRSIPAHMLLKPPEYFLADERDAADALRELRDEGVIASHSRRWFLRAKAGRR